MIRINLLSLAVNLLYALYNGFLGIYFCSWWFITACAYYVILSVLRFSANMYKDKNDRFIMRFSGYMFLALAVVLAGSVYLAVKFETGIKYHEIIMITIATYTFTKITLAIINFVQSGKLNSSVVTTLRSISVADGVVSVFSMQRSMLTSFGEISAKDIKIFNILTGIGVCVVVIILGIYMIRKDLIKWQNQK